jgi:hypothetical protein
MTQFPLYTTRGEWAGLLVNGHLYNTRGEWIGWVERDGTVFSVVGHYVGWLTKDFRVLRKRAVDDETELTRRRPPERPAARVPVPSSVPLPRLMPDLPYDTVDVFEELSERLHTLDADPDAKDID